jgi:hypothetical protein
MLEEITHSVSNQGANGVLDLAAVELVLGDESVDAGLDGSHLCEKALER